MEQLINFIIRPPRGMSNLFYMLPILDCMKGAEYDPNNDLLDEEFMLKGQLYQRKDLEVLNSRGDVLKCSHYMPIYYSEGSKLPCVIYCHGNSGSRTDASEAAVILLPSNITVFTLDFSGSGLSGGEHVTLGWNERDDLRAVVNYLRSDGNVSLIGLWGRSMGAVTSLMYGAEDPSIAGMVLDSPFSDLVDLMMELVDTYKVRLPKFTVKFAIQYMKRAIQKKAKFDITDLNTIKIAKSCFVPVLFGHAIDDDFIDPHHSDSIFDAYVGDKNIIKFEGDHNSPRPQFYFDSISIFFNNVLQPPENKVTSTYFESTPDNFKKGTWSSIYDLDVSDELSDSPTGSTATSTEDAIKQLRSKTPMSSIVIPADISSKDSNHPDSQVESNSHPSSSDMINFELSKDSPRGSTDDDEYVEYPLDMSPDFPTNIEDKERMLMEAVLESLKDLEPNKEQEDSFSTLKTETVSTSEANEHKLDCDKSLSESTPKCVSASEAEDQEEGTSGDLISDSDSPSSNPKSSVADMADGTRVTVQIEKSQSTNILDGLLRRWDLNCFRHR